MGLLFVELLVGMLLAGVFARLLKQLFVGFALGPRRYNPVMATRTMNPVHEATSCAVAACAEIIGAKWTALLVHDMSEGPRRFSELEHSCAGISPRTLSERLRALEDEDLVERRSYSESPPRVEYELTEKGTALLPIIEEMRQFGRAYLTE